MSWTLANDTSLLRTNHGAASRISAQTYLHFVRKDGPSLSHPDSQRTKVGYMSDANYTCTESTMAGLGAETWIRFDGPGGNALKPTCTYRCGMHWTGWLSGWPHTNLQCDNDGAPCGPAIDGGTCKRDSATDTLACMPREHYESAGAYPDRFNF